MLFFPGESEPFAVSGDTLVYVWLAVRQVLKMLNSIAIMVGYPAGPTQMVAVAEKHHRLI